MTENCYSNGGAKEGQGLRQKKNTNKPKTIAVAADDDKRDMFMFTCTLNDAARAEMLDVPRSKLRTCIDSRASKDYCPDRTKFSNYKPIQHKITMADGCLLAAIGIGDLHIKLPNGSGKTKAVFKNAVHTPEMTFMLIVMTSEYIQL